MAIQAWSFSFLCGTQCILAQKVRLHQVLNGCHIFVSFARILLLFGTKFQYLRKRRQDKEGNNLIKLPLETWCSLSVPQCTAPNKGNWNSWCLYCFERNNQTYPNNPNFFRQCDSLKKVAKEVNWYSVLG